MKISKRHLLNYSILIPYLLLSILGLIVVYSTTSATLIEEGKSAFQLVRNQGIFWIASLILIALIYKLKLGFLRNGRLIFIVMIPALIVSYIVSVVFSNGQYQGLGALSEFNMFVFRIAFASFCAYVFGQLLDVLVFNRLRQLKTWWIAPSSSMTFGSLADTFMFFGVAFYQSSDPFMAEHWFSLGFVDYLFKLFVGIVLFVPAYGVVLSMILRKLQSLASSRQFA